MVRRRLCLSTTGDKMYNVRDESSDVVAAAGIVLLSVHEARSSDTETTYYAAIPRGPH